jgi:hypothetical protein
MNRILREESRRLNSGHRWQIVAQARAAALAVRKNRDEPEPTYPPFYVSTFKSLDWGSVLAFG